MSELILRHLFIKAPRETEFQLKKTQSTSKTIKVTYSQSLSIFKLSGYKVLRVLIQYNFLLVGLDSCVYQST